MQTSLSQSPYLRLLDGNRAGRAAVGGKAASLDLLASLGAPVPPAFALTVAAYDAHARPLGLPARASQAEIGQLGAIRQTILGAPIPEKVSRAIEAGLAAIGHDPAGHTLAVRSSATAEDSPHFSFAGLHDTFLDLVGLTAVEQAVKECWASLWNERAVAYRRSGDDTLDTASMAVVVQRLVPCDVAFVIFTADPVAEHHDRHLIISATYGLGEAVVSGLVTPDHIVIGEDGNVERYDVGEKELMIIPAATPGGGVRQVPVPRILGRQPALTHDQARRIGQVARNLDAKLGFRLDIEGGIAGDDIYLFQVRPITTLNGRIRMRRAGP